MENMPKEVVEEKEGTDIEKIPFKLHQFKPLTPNDHEYRVNRYAKIIERTSDGVKSLIKGGTIFRKYPKIGRNTICPKCDSGDKYKNCCGG